VQVLAEAANGLEAVEACRAHRPDVLLIDANMPLMSGEAALRIIGAELPSVRSYLLTADLSPEVIGQALAAGARAYLPKETPLPRMVEWVVEQWRRPHASAAA
jgi:DNA-binding NarL/FixJ family response regulator